MSPSASTLFGREGALLTHLLQGGAPAGMEPGYPPQAAVLSPG